MRFLALFSIGMLALGPCVAADGGSEANSSAQSYGLGQQTERFSAKIVLLPTPAAPVDARGTAQLETADGRGGTLLVKTERLFPGGYWLWAVRRSDGSAVSLGLMAIVDPEFQPDPEAGDRLTSERSTAHPTDFLQNETRVELPPELPPGDIDGIIVSDPGGTHLLAGRVQADPPAHSQH